MKNLYLYRYKSCNVTELRDTKLFCVDSDLGDVYFYDKGYVYKMCKSNVDIELYLNSVTYYNDLPLPEAVDMHFNSVSQDLCIAFENGDILTLDSETRELQCVGSVESGLKAVAWSPDQEMVTLVTGRDMVIVMTSTYDPITEVELHQENFGDKQFITTGWGKKETQFHGSEGKAARIVSNNIEPATDLDNCKTQISWRGDGSLFAVTTVHPDSMVRHMRIFNREGILQYTSEPTSGLEGVLAWRPSGNLIATTQCFPNKYVVAFFEKNGLRHGEFILPFSQQDMSVRHLSWNIESTILAVWCECKATSIHCLQLWTVNNYHWYLKQSLNFQQDDRMLTMDWDVVKGNRLHVVSEGVRYTCYDWVWTTNHSQGLTSINGGLVAVIDGDAVLLTSFRKSVIPPPMCGQTLKLPRPANTVVFGPDTDSLFVVLSDGSLVLYGQNEPMGPHLLLWQASITWENCTCPGPILHHWLWLSGDYLLCCLQSHIVTLTMDFEHKQIFARSCVPVPGPVVGLVAEPKREASIVQLFDGSLLRYEPGQDTTSVFADALPEPCPKFDLREVDGITMSFGLGERNRFYVNGHQVANNVTSYTMHSEFLLMTTLQHTLLFSRLDVAGVEALVAGKSPDTGRRVERGARLIVAVPQHTRVILQMPRGNLECIQPRPLSLHVAATLLDTGCYRKTFELLRTQRINLNLLYDHSPQSFLDNVGRLVDDLDNAAWLSLFLSDLLEEDVTCTMYAGFYCRAPKQATIGNSKVRLVCERVSEVLLARPDSDRFLLPVLTALVKQQTDGDLAAALLHIKTAKQREVAGEKLAVTVDEALGHLLYLVDVNELYNSALGLYDFELVMLVAAKSQKDPKEYLPFLNDLRRMESSYQRFAIDKHLKRYKSALRNIARCPVDQHFEECLQFVKTHGLYSEALGLFPWGSDAYKQLAAVYGEDLKGRKLWQEAAIMFERSGDLESALNAWLGAGDWRAVLSMAQQLLFSENEMKKLCRKLVSNLLERKEFCEAATVLQQHLGDVEECVATLVQGHAWSKVIWAAQHSKRLDLLETHVKPGVSEHLEQVQSILCSSRQQFMMHRKRLVTLRSLKVLKLQCADEEDEPTPECDLFSDTSSVSVTASTRSRSSGKSSSRSSKNKRKHERKLLSLKEGSPFEELALIRALHQLITSTNKMTDEVRDLCQVLLRFDRDRDAAKVQSELASLLGEMENSKAEIWLPSLNPLGEASYGPDATVNSITASLHADNVGDSNLALLEPHLRMQPVTSCNTSWQLSILNV